MLAATEMRQLKIKGATPLLLASALTDVLSMIIKFLLATVLASKSDAD